MPSNGLSVIVSSDFVAPKHIPLTGKRNKGFLRSMRVQSGTITKLCLDEVDMIIQCMLDCGASQLFIVATWPSAE